MIKLRDFYPYILLLLWFFVLGKIFISVTPINLNKSFITELYVKNFVPQGWGFFTRNPRESQFFLCKVNSHNDVEIFTKTNNSIEFYFGLSRKNRLISIETGNIYNSLDTLKYPWIYSKIGNTNFYLDKYINTDTIINKLKPISIQGDYFIVEQQRVPWAWANNYKKIIMPYKYKKIYVRSSY